MAVPIPSDPTAQIRHLAQRVDELSRHRHPGTPVIAEPAIIAGDRSSDTVAILTAVLAALDAASIIVDQTTG
jgi:hypothetical protein